DASLGNTGAGIRLIEGASGNTIGGTVAGAGNVISGNQDGISSRNQDDLISGASGNLIAGNTIGLGEDGDTEVGNTRYGIYLHGSTNTIGGTTAAARNVISANGDTGVFIVGTHDLVQGNYIGTDVSGLLARGNNVAVIMHGTDNTIGGTV